MEIRCYKEGDEIEILKLFQLAFGKEMSMDYWKWRFLENPFDDKLYINLMWEDDVLVGHYAVSPVDMLISGIEQKTALSMTSMTHPDFGGRGIFSKLAESLYSKLEQGGFTMVWGFPNSNSHYGFNKNLDWKDIAVQGMMSLNADVFNRSRKSEVEGSYVEIDKDVANSLNKHDKSITIKKSVAYLKWRYIDNPTAIYKVISLPQHKGSLIYKVIPSFSDPFMNEIDIMDWTFDGDTNLAIELLSIVYNNELNLKQFNLWDALFSGNQSTLEKIGFRLQSPLTYLGYRAFNPAIKEIGDYKNWDLSFSYSDVY